MTSQLDVFGGRRARLSAVFARYRYAVTAFDQVSLSIFAFVLNLCLLRVLSTTDYGIVSLWMTMSLFVASIQGALVIGPLNIHLPAAEDAAAARRLDSALASVNLVSVLATAGILGIVNFSVEAEWAAPDRLTAIAIPLFIAAGMYRAYYRSAAFSRNDMAMLLWVDGPYVAVTTACLAAIVLWPRHFADLAAAFPRDDDRLYGKPALRAGPRRGRQAAPVPRRLDRDLPPDQRRRRMVARRRCRQPHPVSQLRLHRNEPRRHGPARGDQRNRRPVPAGQRAGERLGACPRCRNCRLR